MIYLAIKTIYLCSILIQLIYQDDMPLRILVVSATQTESEILKAVNGIDLIPLVTGVGAVATAWTLTRYLCV